MRFAKLHSYRKSPAELVLTCEPNTGFNVLQRMVQQRRMSVKHHHRLVIEATIWVRSHFSKRVFLNIAFIIPRLFRKYFKSIYLMDVGLSFKIQR